MLKDWPRALVTQEQGELKDTVEIELAECSGGLEEWGEKLRCDVRIPRTDVWQLMSEHRLEKGW